MADPVIEHYTTERVPNHNPGGEVAWQLYHTVRNSVFRCCHRYGASGAMGECPITFDDEPPYQSWPTGDPDPIDFFVVDDQYNHERYIYVEVETTKAFTADWMRELILTLAEYPGWGVGIKGITMGYILAFAEKLMVTGPVFDGCEDFVSVVSAAQSALRAAPPPDDAK